MVERLVLGTVQFGLEYGVANRGGQVSAEDAATILDRALEMGIDTLDTAIAYGASEETLGRIGVQAWNVVTKLPAVPESIDDIDGWVEDAVNGSLRRLRISTLHGLLLHDPRQLAGTMGDRLFEALAHLKEQRLVEKIGISIYHPTDLDALCGRYSLDLVQAPFNVLDRRLATSGWLTRLHDAGTEVHIRSVFLQGLLLMPTRRRPPSFSRWQPLWDRWDNWLSYSNLTALRASLGFALSQPDVDRVVVGVDSVEQLEEIFAAVGAAVPAPPMELMTDDLDLIDPSRWKKL
jgi:aryl-alcohol dehydrogenase-like predicted oxidoreductase